MPTQLTVTKADTLCLVHERPVSVNPPRIHYELDEAAYIARLFDISQPIRVEEFPFKGNINQHTFLVSCANNGEYLLQRINHEVFTKPDNTMAAMIASIEAQNHALAKGELPDGEEWLPIRLVPTRAGKSYLQHNDHHGYTVWRLMVRIPDCATYKSLSELPADRRLHYAEEAGRGLARYLRFTRTVPTTGLASPLPGYRDTRLYYNQLLSVLSGSRSIKEADAFLPDDEETLHSTADHFRLHISKDEHCRRVQEPFLQPYIRLATENQGYALSLLRGMESGRIRTCAIHGDTKLENFLFCNRTERAKALVDLDTIMPLTWLADWGDMVRSLVNVAGEKETDLEKVQVDLEVYEALARGFLRTFGQIEPAELDLMVDAVQIIALELGIRFLADYLRGDSYFLIGPGDPADLNRTRALVQLTLFQRLREREAESRLQVAKYVAT